MANTGLEGPFSLSNAGVDAAVKYLSPGAYALGDINSQNQFVVKYVGRSDDNVNSRLKDHVPEPYLKFKFKYYDSAKDAYYKECALYHDFSPDGNEIHPAAPSESYLSCPVCGR